MHVSLRQFDVIVDRDTKYTQQFRRLVEERGMVVIRLPAKSPNLNAHSERFVHSIPAASTRYSSTGSVD